MIILEDVTLTYRDEIRPALQHLTLSFPIPCRVALLGLSGSGKTTLAKLMKGLLHPDSGTVRRLGIGAHEIGYLGTDPASWIVGISVEEDLAFGMENLCIPREEMHTRLNWAAREFDLLEMLQRHTHTLSDGEQQKVLLASLLAMGARLLVLDESLSMLDPPSRLSVGKVLGGLRGERELGVVEITNNLADAVCADRLVVLHEGRVAFDGAPGEFLVTEAGRRWAEWSGGVPALAAELMARGNSVVLPVTKDDWLPRVLDSIIG